MSSSQCLRAWCVFLCVVWAGCDDGTDKSSGTPGERGRVQFSYARSCFFGCPLEQPLLVGTRERIDLSGAGDIESLEVTSSDESIAEFAVERACFCERSDSTRRLDIAEDAKCDAPWHKHCDNHVLVQANDAGDAWLELHDAEKDGVMIDRARVQVEEAHSAHFEGTLPHRLGPISGTRFELTPGDSLELEMTLYDVHGRSLLAPEGVTWRTDDDAVATLSAFLIGSGPEVSAGLQITVQAVSAGLATLSADVPGLENAEVDIRVAQ
jgi:hypothetical protein